MIGRLSGIIVNKKPPVILLDVNGVGYEVEAPMSTFYVLPEVNEKIHLLIHTHVREDALHLFGFASESERWLFRTLIKVSGVGARSALSILSGISVADFTRCIQNDDIAALTRLPGVGKKTAQRLLVEMKDKLSFDVEERRVELRADLQPASASPVNEAIEALLALGYKPVEASRMVRAVQNATTTEEIIRLALQSSVRA